MKKTKESGKEKLVEKEAERKAKAQAKRDKVSFVRHLFKHVFVFAGLLLTCKAEQLQCLLLEI